MAKDNAERFAVLKQRENNMESSINIFSIKSVSFLDGERDPFGFDEYARNLGSAYLPFSGSVSKPSYFLFVAYVHHFLTGNKSLWKNEKQKQEIQVRLEKLLVYCWKKTAKEQSEQLRGSAILGNSFELDDIDVFSSKGWVIQNAFKIYTEKNFCPSTLELYLRKIGNRQSDILRDFIKCDYKLPRYRKEYLDDLLKQLRKKDSLFNNHCLEPDLQKRFKKELLEKIQIKRKVEYMNILQPFFEFRNFNEEHFWGKLLENPKLPFLYLNSWFSKFVAAVNADINDKETNKHLWNEADKSFEDIPTRFHSISKTTIVLQKRIRKCKWFQYNEKEKRYAYYDRGNLSERRRIKNMWELYTKRQGEEVGARYFFNYRHYALLRLLKELQ